MLFKKTFSMLMSICFVVAMFSVTSFVSSASVLDEELAGTLYSVKEQGAKGDGKTDDTNAIIAAMDAVEQRGESTLYFPAGTYYVNAKLSVKNTIELVFAEGAKLKFGPKGNFRMYGGIVAGNYQIFEFDSKAKMGGSNGVTIGNPFWFGAKGDGKTDDTVAIQRTLDAFSCVNFAYTEKGYLFSDVTFDHSGKIMGANREKRVKFIAASGTDKLITLEGSYIEMYSFDIEMKNAPQSTVVFFNNKSVLEQNRLEDITTYNAGNAVRDSGEQMIITTEFINMKCFKGNGTAFVCNNMWGFMFLKNVLIDYSESKTKMDFPAVTVANNAGMILTGVTIIGSENTTSNAHGFVSYNSEAMWWEHCTVKNVGGTAFLHTGRVNQHLYFYDCHVENAGVNSFAFPISEKNHRAWFIQLSHCSVNGGKGIYLDGSCAQFSNVTISNVEGNAISSTSSNSVFTDITLNNNKGYGIESTGNACSYVNIKGSGNTSALTNLSGSGNVITEY